MEYWTVGRREISEENITLVTARERQDTYKWKTDTEGIVYELALKVMTAQLRKGEEGKNKNWNNKNVKAKKVPFF